jgi:hypothetical protein
MFKAFCNVHFVWFCMLWLIPHPLVLWQNYRSMECIYVCMYVCMYVCTAFTYICDVTFHLLNLRLNCRSIVVMLKMLECMWLHMSVGPPGSSSVPTLICVSSEIWRWLYSSTEDQYVYVFYKQAVVAPPEDGLSISRNICWGSLSNIL